MFGHILVPLDGSRLAEKALEYAHNLVRPGGKLTLLSVIRLPEVAFPAPYTGFGSAYRALGPEAPGEYMAQQGLMLEDAQKYLERLAETIKGGENLHIECVTKVGDPADVIVVTAREHKVEAIVMSTHGRSGVTRWLFGSVTMRVLETACCPVLVIPSRNIEKQAEAKPETAHADS